ncbi:hypothetical protein BJ166DRAFT_139297 [Pestalotiopsis sp. NC0098]|nr:hypothetical protein BJ166DRAFT_139297 [Pestalotiopsis sp. NC0098]
MISPARKQEASWHPLGDLTAYIRALPADLDRHGSSELRIFLDNQGSDIYLSWKTLVCLRGFPDPPPTIPIDNPLVMGKQKRPRVRSAENKKSELNKNNTSCCTSSTVSREPSQLLDFFLYLFFIAHCCYSSPASAGVYYFLTTPHYWKFDICRRK